MRFIDKELNACGIYSRGSDTLESRINALNGKKSLARIWESCCSRLDTSALDFENSLVTTLAKVKVSLLHSANDIINLNNKVIFTISICGSYYQAKAMNDISWVSADDFNDLKTYAKENWDISIHTY